MRGCKAVTNATNRLYFLFLFQLLCGFFISPAFSQQPSVSGQTKLALYQAAMCEGIEEFEPINEAIVFSISLGKVYCFTYFEPVPQKTWIFHNYYFQDRLIAKAKLIIKPPNWKTYSSIQLREPDKGPWRVEITDSAGRVFKVLRFSITD